MTAGFQSILNLKLLIIYAFDMLKLKKQKENFKALIFYKKAKSNDISRFKDDNGNFFCDCDKAFIQLQGISHYLV
jgi:hypothetical protein